MFGGNQKKKSLFWAEALPKFSIFYKTWSISGRSPHQTQSMCRGEENKLWCIEIFFFPSNLYENVQDWNEKGLGTHPSKHELLLL